MSKLLAPLFALTVVGTLALGGYALGDDGAPDPDDRRLVQVPESEHADVREAPDDASGHEVAEPDEGPGTTAPVAPVDRPVPAPQREVAEPYEGPGTVDEPVHGCLEVDGRTVCDTLGEADEGPGTR